MTKDHIKYHNFNPLIILVSVFLLISIILTVFSFVLFKKSQTKNQSSQSQSQSVLPTPSDEEINKIIQKVSRHIILPSETPKMITVTNVETLKKDQPFFTNAKNGHHLLVYANKVIIYDPVEDKIVDVAYIKPTQTPVPSLNPVSLSVPMLSITPTSTIPSDL